MDLTTLQETPPWEWPSNAGPFIQQALVDKGASESDRLVAAELAGDLVIMNDSLAAALMTVVGSADESPELRAKAAISLGPVLEQADTMGFDDPEDVPITLLTFRGIQDLLGSIYADDNTPKEVRRRILEASVRAPEEWHGNAIADAYASGDPDWVLTAVFAMRYVQGFEPQILESLNSPDPEIHYEAVVAAGNWELDGAWPHVVALVDSRRTPKPLLIAAIAAVADIRPQEAGEILANLADSKDNDIAEAAGEAIAMAEGYSEWEEEDEETTEWLN